MNAKVAITPSGRFALVSGETTVAVLCDEGIALLYASALNRAPVQGIDRETHVAPRGFLPLFIPNRKARK